VMLSAPSERMGEILRLLGAKRHAEERDLSGGELAKPDPPTVAAGLDVQAI